MTLEENILHGLRCVDPKRPQINVEAFQEYARNLAEIHPRATREMLRAAEEIESLRLAVSMLSMERSYFLKERKESK
jgi:hypothetical protein